MPTSSQISTTIFNGQTALGYLTNANYTLVSQGQEASKPDFVQWFRLNLQGLIDQYAIGDYTSSTTVTLFNRINTFVGIPIGATVDPAFENPNVTIIVNPPFTPTPPYVTTQASLIQDGNGVWYLPTPPLIANQIPVQVTVVGVLEYSFPPDMTNNNTRIYGFSDNSTAVITVYFNL
jgi:hypothetical protein